MIGGKTRTILSPSYFISLSPNGLINIFLARRSVLCQNNFPMILFLYGNDSYRLQTRVQFLKEAFQAKYDEYGHSIDELDGTQCTSDDIRRVTRSNGLFSKKRFIIMRHVWDLSKETQEMLVLEWEKIDADTILCIVAEHPPRKDHFLFERLLKSKKVERYDELTPSQLRAFIRQKVTEWNSVIDEESVNIIATSIGNNLWRLHFELKKITAYAKNIHADDVRQFINEPLDENIFHLTDALSARDCKRATKLLEEQLMLGAHPQYLLTMLARQIGIILRVKMTNGDGLKLHPYVVEQARRQSREFSLEELHRLATQLLHMDYKLKTESRDPHLLLDLFVVDVCQKKISPTMPSSSH